MQVPISVIDKSFHDTILQGLAPDPTKNCKVIPLIPTYSSNYSNRDIVTETNTEFTQSSNKSTIYKSKQGKYRIWYI